MIRSRAGLPEVLANCDKVILRQLVCRSSNALGPQIHRAGCAFVQLPDRQSAFAYLPPGEPSTYSRPVLGALGTLVAPVSAGQGSRVGTSRKLRGFPFGARRLLFVAHALERISPSRAAFVRRPGRPSASAYSRPVWFRPPAPRARRRGTLRGGGRARQDPIGHVFSAKCAERARAPHGRPRREKRARRLTPATRSAARTGRAAPPRAARAPRRCPSAPGP